VHYRQHARMMSGTLKLQWLGVRALGVVLSSTSEAPCAAYMFNILWACGGYCAAYMFNILWACGRTHLVPCSGAEMPRGSTCPDGRPGLFTKGIHVRCDELNRGGNRGTCRASRRNVQPQGHAEARGGLCSAAVRLARLRALSSLDLSSRRRRASSPYR
jgi:hypothetical protein